MNKFIYLPTHIIYIESTASEPINIHEVQMSKGTCSFPIKLSTETLNAEIHTFRCSCKLKNEVERSALQHLHLTG